MRGEVWRWVTERGFGFVRVPGTTALAFVHQEMLPPGQVPMVGDVLEFDGVEDAARGPRVSGWVSIVDPATPEQEQTNGDK